MNKKSLTLLESIVATLLLSITMWGLANIFIAAKRNIQHSRFKILAAESGKFYLERLPMDVRDGTYPATCAGGNISACPGNLTLPDGTEFGPSYDLSDLNGARRVRLVITWNEWYD